MSSTMSGDLCKSRPLTRSLTTSRSCDSLGRGPVKPDDLIRDLPNLLKSGALQAEFQILPRVFPFATDAGRSESVTKKNRDRETVPYDHNRVILTAPEFGIVGDKDTDYINASFIRSLPGHSGYIATQGPMLGTLEDFWSMVWSQNSHVVLMLCRLVENCQNQSYKYWPDVGDCLDLEDVNLRTEEEDTRSVYVIRKFSLRHCKTGERREITHLQFTAWPDDGYPCPGALLSLWRAFRSLQDAGSGPAVLQCSNGSDRSGLFAVLDTVVSQWQEMSSLDVVSCVLRVREDRQGVLESFEQYVYLYNMLVEIIQCTRSSKIEMGKPDRKVEERCIDQRGQTDNNENIDFGLESILLEYKVLNSTGMQVPNDKDKIFVYPCTGPNTSIGCSAHRFLYPDVSQDLLVICVPLEQRSVKRSSDQRVYRLRHSISLQESKMMLGIAGVLPSQCQSSFLVSSSVSKCEGSELWQLVFDSGCRTVVRLAEKTVTTKTAPWPLCTEDFSIEATSHLRIKGVLEETTLALRTNMQPWSPLDGDISPETTIKLFTVPWPQNASSSDVMLPADVIVFLYELLRRWLHQSKTTVIAIDCGSRTDVSGHFCAAFNMLSILQTDGEVNMRQVVRAVQCALPGAISQEAYLHLYRLRDHFVQHRSNTRELINKRRSLTLEPEIVNNDSCEARHKE